MEIPERSDVYLEEFWLPRKARSYDALVTPREQLRLVGARPATVLQLHEHQQTRYARLDSMRAALRGAHQQYRASASYQSVDHICFSSGWTRDQFTVWEGRAPASASVVHLSGWADDVASGLFQLEKDNTVLIMASSDPRDDLNWGLRAWEMARLPAPWTLVVVGDGPAVEGGDVRRVGRLSDEDLLHEMRAASAYLHIGRCEGFGLAVVEALQAGTPVIARGGSAVDELLARGGGGLVATAAEAAAALQALALDPDRQSTSRQAHAAGTLFSWSSTARGLADGVRAAVEQRR